MSPKKRSAPAAAGGGQGRGKASKKGQGELPPIPADSKVLPHIKMLDTWMFLN